VLKRLTMGIGGLLLLALAALASMIRIVPSDAPAPAAPTGVADAPGSGGSWSHPPLTMPVQGVEPARIADTWGQSRANGARTHQATDIIAPGGTPVLAAAPGTVEKLFYSHGGGGVTLYVRSPDRQWTYYYAHLQGYAPGVAEGVRVKAGDLIGYVGDTGNSGAGNFHLHFAVSHMAPGERWHQGTPVNPFPLLVAGRR
jgi:murein DD-endopeptidase MepM/ murein hydrolase activator NlpD